MVIALSWGGEDVCPLITPPVLSEFALTLGFMGGCGHGTAEDRTGHHRLLCMLSSGVLVPVDPGALTHAICR